MYSYLENYVKHLLLSIEITDPEHLTIENVSHKLNLEVSYNKKAYRFSNEILLERGTKQQEWTCFAHELGHYLMHSGIQLTLPPLAVNWQEKQANHFTYHFCVPTFMLEKLKPLTVYDVSNLFNVEYDFAIKRIEMYQNKIISKGDKICELQYM